MKKKAPKNEVNVVNTVNPSRCLRTRHKEIANNLTKTKQILKGKGSNRPSSSCNANKENQAIVLKKAREISNTTACLSVLTNKRLLRPRNDISENGPLLKDLATIAQNIPKVMPTKAVDKQTMETLKKTLTAAKNIKKHAAVPTVDPSKKRDNGKILPAKKSNMDSLENNGAAKQRVLRARQPVAKKPAVQKKPTKVKKKKDEAKNGLPKAKQGKNTDIVSDIFENSMLTLTIQTFFSNSNLSNKKFTSGKKDFSCDNMKRKLAFSRVEKNNENLTPSANTDDSVYDFDSCNPIEKETTLQKKAGMARVRSHVPKNTNSLGKVWMKTGKIVNRTKARVSLTYVDQERRISLAKVIQKENKNKNVDAGSNNPDVGRASKISVPLSKKKNDVSHRSTSSNQHAPCKASSGKECSEQSINSLMVSDEGQQTVPLPEIPSVNIDSADDREKNPPASKNLPSCNNEIASSRNNTLPCIHNEQESTVPLIVETPIARQCNEICSPEKALFNEVPRMVADQIDGMSPVLDVNDLQLSLASAFNNLQAYVTSTPDKGTTASHVPNMVRVPCALNLSLEADIPPTNVTDPRYGLFYDDYSIKVRQLDNDDDEPCLVKKPRRNYANHSFKTKKTKKASSKVNKRTKAANAKFDAWAANLNNHFDEIDNSDLVVETYSSKKL